MAKKIRLDLDACLGYGNCVVEAPELFDLDEATDKAIVLKESVEEPDLETAEIAVRVCPAMALALESPDV
jgi:ferredoxin